MPEKFIWSQDKIREKFQKYRLWPSFIGSRTDPFSEYSGLLPMLLWEEQATYLDEQKAIEKQNERSSSRKRKRSDIFDDHHVDDTSSFSVRKFLKSVFGFRSKPLEPSLESEAPTATQSSVVASQSKQDTTTKKSREEKQQEMTFKFLQSEGFFVGPADVYGGDYSIYRGADPTESHATATIRLCHSKTMSARELLAFSRIQNQVAKSSVITYVELPQSTAVTCLLCVNKKKNKGHTEKEGKDADTSCSNDSSNDLPCCVICENITNNSSAAGNVAVVDSNSNSNTRINFVVVNFKSVSARLPMT